MPFTGAQAGHGRMDTTKGRTRHAVSQIILKLLKCVPVCVFDFEMMMAFIAVTAKDYSTVRHRNPTGLKFLIFQRWLSLIGEADHCTILTYPPVVCMVLWSASTIKQGLYL
jgi:hypothetical protein